MKTKAEWNPVEGLTRLAPDEIREGDVVRVRQYASGAPSYRQIIVKKVTKMSKEEVYIVHHKGGSIYLYPFSDVNAAYLVERPVMEEPQEMGEMVYIKEEKRIYVFIRLFTGSLRPWCVFRYDFPSFIFPDNWNDMNFVDWNNITTHNPQPYHWGDVL